jgi:Ca-activated chloride channel family protein
MKRLLPVVVCAAAMLAASVVYGQGIIVDQRPDERPVGAYEVRRLSIDAQVKHQVAEVQVTQVFANPTRSVMEVEYWFPLPDDGAVQNLVLLVDGKELPGRVLPRDEARRIYEEIVRRRRDPALLEYMGQGLFRTSVFPVPAGAERTVTLRYTRICRRENDLVTFSYPLGTQKHAAKPVGRLSIKVQIKTEEPIKAVYSPTHDVRTKQTGERSATVALDQRDVTDLHDFQAIYTHAPGTVGASLISYRPHADKDGYFMLLAAPGFPEADRTPVPKNVVFVIDKSGSMQGKKIEQAREAAKFIVNNLRDRDTFNIVAYDDRIDSFAPEMQRYGQQTRSDALAYIDNLRAGGSTNIDGALRHALKMLREESGPTYVLFMTDGLPTAGERDEMKIASNAKRANKAGARLINFGVGYDVNARLLDRLSRGSHGASEYVKPDASLEAAVSRYYEKVTAPVMTEIKVAFAGTAINRAYPRELPDLFEGGQLVWVGRYADAGRTTVTVDGKVGEDRLQLQVAATLAAGDDPTFAFVERLWAVRRVGYLIDEIDLQGRNKELITELVDLSSRYGILTPYTSFLADEDAPMGAAAENVTRADTASVALDQLVTGKAGAAQRQMKSDLMRSAQPVATSRAEAADLEGNVRKVDTVRRVGRKVFYRKGNRWVDAAVPAEGIRGAIDIRQYSDAWFELARSQSAERNQYLALEEDVTVELGGQVYNIHR